MLLFFSYLTFSNNSLRNTIRLSIGLDPYQDQHSVYPDQGPNCLQKLLADNEIVAIKITVRHVL